MAAGREGRRKGSGELPLVRSVERAGRVLEALLVASPEGLRLAEIAEQVGLHKTTALRLLRTLTEIGVIRRQREGDRYAWDAIHWLAVAAKLHAMSARVDAVQAILDELAISTGETIGLAYPDGSKRQVLFVAVSLSPNQLRVDPGNERRWPLHAGAHGKVCLAYFPDEMLLSWLTGPLPRLTANTITSPEELMVALKQIREQGYAVSFEEGFIGACGVAVPVRNDTEEVVAALGLTAPVARTTEDRIKEWVQLLEKNSQKLSKALYLKDINNLPDRESKTSSS